MDYKYTSIKIGNTQYRAIVNEITKYSIIGINIIEKLDIEENIVVNNQQLRHDAGKFKEINLEFSLAKRNFKETFVVVKSLGLSVNIILEKNWLRNINGKIKNNREGAMIRTDSYTIYLSLTTSKNSDQNPTTSRKNKHDYYI